LILTPGKCEWTDLALAIEWPLQVGLRGNPQVTEVLHPGGVAFSWRCRGQWEKQGAQRRSGAPHL